MKKNIGMLIIIAFIIGIFSYKLFNREFEKKEEKSSYVVNILPNSVDEMSSIYDNRFIIREDKKYGIMNIDGIRETESQFDLIIRMYRNTYLFQKNGKSELLNLDSNKRIEVDAVEYIGEKLFKVVYNDKYGIIDENLNELLKIEYNFIETNNNYILTFKGNKRELYDIKGKKIEFENQDKYFGLGIGKYLYNRENNKYGVIDEKGKQIIEPKYNSFLKLNENNILIGYKEDENYFINLEKKIEKKIDYENYSNESQGMIMVLKNGKIGYIDIEGRECIPTIYDGGFVLKEGKDFLQVKSGEKWQLLDKYGKKKYNELDYEDMGVSSDGYILVEKRGKFGYIDESGEVKIPLEYEVAADFRDGVAIVAKESGFGVIDKKNNIKISLIYDEIVIKDGKAYVLQDNKYGLLDLQENEILPVIYDKLEYIDKNTLFFKKGKETGYFEFGVKNNGDKKL